MDPLSHLPIECLQPILQILLDSNSLSALARLLTMNKHIASVTLPYLYHNPYHLIHRREKYRTYRRTGELLTRMLLGCLPVTSIPEALTLALTTDKRYPPPPTTTSPLNYLAHIRHLKIDLFDSLTVGCSWSMKDMSLEQRTYIRTEEFGKRYQSNLFTSKYINGSYLTTKGKVLQHFYHVVLHQEAVWCLASPILEQLHSFTVPYMFTIKQYLQVVGRFKSLGTISFTMTDKFEESYYRSEPPEKGSHNYKVDQDMIRFVQEHAQLCEGRLKSVNCLEYSEWGLVNKEYGDRIQLDIFRILPPLSKPTYLNKDNFIQFSAHPQSIDLKHVREFNSQGLPKWWEDIISNDQPLLQRCRTLKRLLVDNIHAGTFRWAAQEKRDFDQTGKSTAVDNRHGHRGALMLEGTSPPLHETQSLVPLERIEIRQLADPRIDDINDILFAFQHSLKSLSITALVDVSLDLPRSIHLEKGWVDLPVLSHLILNMGLNRLVVGSQALSHCPNLVLLRLSDWTLEYSCQDIIPCPPVHLDQLDVLHLSGWPALTFNPTTLSSVTKLTSLIIQVQPRYYVHVARGFIPPLEELDRSYGFLNDSETAMDDLVLGMVRPLWTWDWHLPLLTSLNLSSEFALFFEFKMLNGCPALKTLILDIQSSTPEEHTRFICDGDLWISAEDSARYDESSALSSSPSTQPTTEFICAPALAHLELGGEWVIESDIMPAFLTDLFPELTDVYLNGWNMTTLESLLELVRAMPSTYDHSVSLHVSDLSGEDMYRLGIVNYEKWENVRPDALDINMSNYYDDSELYLLLKDLPE
ncbi:hypothetical protein BGZ96_012342 [Linnemannia gamsii]|uniref:F-box domain-containing protein n=1 Tax=Linnemannia gamsii TaxID=64522 RepID=A0ABQ7JQK4_9FUNG|nr:hypothetical protein BGZ96_012342 [Linnemannia gamsii]